MNCLIAKIKTGKKNNATYKKIISDKQVCLIPNNLSNALDYSPQTLHEENEWYKIDNFSNKPYSIKLIKKEFSSVNYNLLDKKEIDLIDYICSIQGDKYCFQNIGRAILKPKRMIHLGDNYSFEEKSKNIIIKDFPDAIYDKTADTLYFQSISRVTSIFKGIEELYREATDEETARFLNQDFIRLGKGFDANKVKTRNRQRIAIATDTLSNLKKKERNEIFKYIASYCPELNPDKDEQFTISSDEDLTYLLYGVDQRFYTTGIGLERRIADSYIKMAEKKKKTNK